MLSTLPFSTLQHLVKACGKELAGVCELGLLLGLIGILISDGLFKSSLKVELVSLYSDYKIRIPSTAPPGRQAEGLVISHYEGLTTI